MKLSEKEYIYKIGDKEYHMYGLKMGQVHQLLDLLKDVDMPQELTVATLITSLGPALKEAIAVILHVPGVELRDKNITEIAEEITFKI